VRGLLTLWLLAGCDGVFGLRTFSVPDAPPSGLVAWYPLDYATVMTFIDATMRGHTGTCTSPQCPVAVAGHLDGAMRFDGVDDQIDIADAGDLDLAAFTIAFWVWIDDLTHGGCPVNKPFGTGSEDSWQLCLDSTGVVYLFSTGSNTMSSTALTAGAWRHVALRYDGGEATITLDGADVAIVLDTIAYDANPVTLGADTNLGQVDAAFAGMLDEVKIFDHALTRDEIAALARQ